MGRSSRVCHRLVLACGLLTPLGAGAAEVSYDLFSEHASGRFGTGVVSEVSSVVFGLESGSRLRLRIEIPYLRARSPALVILNRLGITQRELERLEPARRASLLDRIGEQRDGLGDVRLELALPLAGGGTALHLVEALIEVKAPTADDEELLGTGAWDYRLGLLGEYRSWSLTSFASLGWSRLGAAPDLELNDVFDASLGLESPPFGERWALAAWLEGNSAVTPASGSRLAAGLGVSTLARVAWRFALTAGLTDAAEDFGFRFGVAVRAGGRSRRRP